VTDSSPSPDELMEQYVGVHEFIAPLRICIFFHPKDVEPVNTFYGKFCAVMIQYVTFRMESLVGVTQRYFQVERIRMCINTKALIARNVETVCLRLSL
jgi:hypothetical protein